MKENLWNKLGDFVLGKGFYIVLFLCVATIGISGYYLIQSVSTDPQGGAEPVTGTPSVVLPDQDAVQDTSVKKPVTVKPQESTKSDDQQKETQQPAQEPVQPQAAAPKTSAPAVYTWPVKGDVLRGMSVDALAYDQTMGDWRTHAGLDIAAEEGFSVLCVSDGVVSEIVEDDLMGVTVVVEHPDGLVSSYSNLAQEPAVSVGQEVDTGTVLGTVGVTAIAESAMATHLHLEMTKDGEAVDPTAYLPGK